MELYVTALLGRLRIYFERLTNPFSSSFPGLPVHQCCYYGC
jgi:hypothetical protein